MSHQILNHILISLLVAVAPTCAWAKRNFGTHPGYLASTEGERSEKSDDIVVIQPPKTDGPTLREKIFNDNLTREFRERYEEKFGRTEVDRVYNSPNRFTYYDNLYGFKGTAQEYTDERRAYADFMLKRLLEFHIDNYAKEDPKLRGAWEAKEKIKEFKVEVSGFRLDAQYSIAGNTFDMKVYNPYLTLTRVRLQMAGNFGPGPVEESIISLGRNVTKDIYSECHWAVSDGIFSVIGRKTLTPALASTLTSSTFTRPSGKSLRESRYLAGLSYIF